MLRITVYGYGTVGNVGSNVSSPACRSASTTTLSCTHRRISVPSNSASTTIPSVHSLGSVICVDSTDTVMRPSRRLTSGVEPSMTIHIVTGPTVLVPRGSESSLLMLLEHCLQHMDLLIHFHFHFHCHCHCHCHQI
jgi:hypothetical protein